MKQKDLLKLVEGIAALINEVGTRLKDLIDGQEQRTAKLEARIAALEKKLAKLLD